MAAVVTKYVNIFLSELVASEPTKRIQKGNFKKNEMTFSHIIFCRTFFRLIFQELKQTSAKKSEAKTSTCRHDHLNKKVKELKMVVKWHTFIEIASLLIAKIGRSRNINSGAFEFKFSFQLQDKYV